MNEKIPDKKIPGQGLITGLKITANTVRLSIALIIRKFMTLFYFILIVKCTDTDITGLYFLLASLSIFFASLMDFGLPPVFIREASKKPSDLKRYLDNIIGLKCFLTLAAVASGVTLMSALDYPSVTRNLVYMVLILISLESFAFVFFSALRVDQQMRYEAWGTIIGQCITIAIGSTILLTGWAVRENALYFLILALLINQASMFFFSAYHMRKRLGLKIGFKLEAVVIKPLIRDALPFLVIACFEKILFLDTIVLSHFTNETIIALLGPPLTIIGAFQFIPAAVEATIYPALSVLHVSSHDKMERVFERSFTALMLIIIPAAIGLSILAGEIVEFFFGRDYLSSVTAMRIMAVSLVLIFATTPIFSLLNAIRQQMTTTILLGITTVLHIGLALFLIPHYQINGIATAAILSQLFLFLSGFYRVRKILSDVLLRQCLVNLGRTSLATIPMGFVVYYLKWQIHFLLVIPIGFLIYLLSAKILNLLKGFGLEQFTPSWPKKVSSDLSRCAVDTEDSR